MESIMAFVTLALYIAILPLSTFALSLSGNYTPSFIEVGSILPLAPTCNAKSVLQVPTRGDLCA